MEKEYHKVYMFGKRYGWPTAENVVFPRKWTEWDKTLYFETLSRRKGPAKVEKIIKENIPDDIVLSKEQKAKLLEDIVEALRKGAVWN